MLETAEDVFAAGNSLFVDEDFTGALKKYNEAIELDGRCAKYFIARAAVHLNLHHEIEALDDSSKAIELEPNNPNGFLRKGRALFALSEYEMAKTVFQKGKALDPDNPHWNTWLRKCDAELALEEASDYSSVPPAKSSDSTIPSYQPLSQMPSVSSAVGAAATPLATPSGGPSPATAKAETAKQLGNKAFTNKKYREACEHYSKAIELDPTNHVYYSNRAMSYTRLGEHQKALDDSNKVIQLSPEWAKGFYRKGTALMGLRKYSLAEEAFLTGMRFTDEKDFEEVKKGLDSAQEFARLEKHGAYHELRSRRGGPNDKDLLSITTNNLNKLRSEEFAKLSTTITVTVGDKWRCMRSVVVDDEGLIIRLTAPNAMLKTDESLFNQLREGDLFLVNLYVHVGKKGTPKEGQQEYAFEGWKGRQAAKKEEDPKKEKGFVQALVSEELSLSQQQVLHITVGEANAISGGVFNPHINRLLKI